MTAHQDQSTSDLITYYQNLLILQYNTKSKALATVAAFVGEAIANQIVDTVQQGFDLDDAVGAQLDILGTYRGAMRTIFGVNVNRQYFSMPGYHDSDIGTVKGFGVYSQGSSGITWYWLRYPDTNQVSYSLNDDEFRKLIKFRAATQSCNFGLGTLDAIFFTFFGTNVNIIDNKDMTITYHHTLSDPDTLFSIVNQTNSLPRPAGVSYTVVES